MAQRQGNNPWEAGYPVPPEPLGDPAAGPTGPVKPREPGLGTLLIVLLVGIVHALAWLHAPESLRRVIACPWSAYGNLDSKLLTVALPAALYILVTIAGLWMALRWLIRRRNGESLPVSPGLLRWLVRPGPRFLASPLVVLLALFCVLRPWANDCWWTGMGGNSCWYIKSDKGAEKRAPLVSIVFGIGISDVGAGHFKAANRAVMVTIKESPEMTIEGLKMLGGVTSLRDLSFYADESRNWGDEEATAVTQSPGIEDLSLHGFVGVTNGWLMGLVGRLPALTSVSISGRHGITKEGLEMFIAARPDVSADVSGFEPSR